VSTNEFPVVGLVAPDRIEMRPFQKRSLEAVAMMVVAADIAGSANPQDG
jgi:hypothetical protein